MVCPPNIFYTQSNEIIILWGFLINPLCLERMKRCYMSPSPRALLSVYDKTGLVDFATNLVNFGWEIISTGGTAKKLREAGLKVKDISDITNHPEIFDGRVKSLHPAIHGPLLARLENKKDSEGLEELGYQPIKLVAVNLYPFSASASQSPPLDDSELLEMIDIGGPTLLRASAKNHRNVISVSNPKRYSEIIELLSEVQGDPEKISLEQRKKYALETFEHTASYDIAISKELHKRWIGEANKSEDLEDSIKKLPRRFQIDSKLTEIMRYGENPHQTAAFYANPTNLPINLADFVIHSGKALSYNNYVDIDAALRLARNLSTEDWPETPHACIIVKHNNPCGAALSVNQENAWSDALASDSESAFGCIVAFNTKVTKATAQKIGTHFIECIIAPSFDEEALESLSASVREVGVLQPILVRRKSADSFELIAGERRWRAAKRAGLDRIPAMVRDIEDLTTLEHALVENLHRQDLGALEEAAAFQQLIDDFGLSQDAVAKRVGKSRPTIANALRLLQLPASVQNFLLSGSITAGHARALLGLASRQEQDQVAQRIVNESLTVRDVEKIVREGINVRSKPKKPKERSAAELEVEQILSEKLSTRVGVSIGSRKGKILIEFADTEDLSRILKIISDT